MPAIAAKRFTYTPNALDPLASSPTSVTANTYSFPGAVPVVSANGNADAIVWTLNGAGGLEAYAATGDGLGTLLYASTQNSARDKPPTYVKYTVPLVDNGHVFVAGKGGIASYGLVNTSTAEGTSGTTIGATSTGTVGTGSVTSLLPGPSGTIATDLPVFTWSTVSGAASYEIWLTDQTTNTHVTYDHLTGTSWLPPQALVLGTNYIWWVGGA